MGRSRIHSKPSVAIAAYSFRVTFVGIIAFGWRSRLQHLGLQTYLATSLTEGSAQRAVLDRGRCGRSGDAN